MNPPDLSKYPDDADKKLVWLAWCLSRAYHEQIAKPATIIADARLRKEGVPIVKLDDDGTVSDVLLCAADHLPFAAKMHYVRRVAEELVAKN